MTSHNWAIGDVISDGYRIVCITAADEAYYKLCPIRVDVDESLKINTTKSFMLSKHLAIATYKWRTRLDKRPEFY